MSDFDGQLHGILELENARRSKQSLPEELSFEEEALDFLKEFIRKNPELTRTETIDEIKRQLPPEGKVATMTVLNRILAQIVCNLEKTTDEEFERYKKLVQG